MVKRKKKLFQNRFDGMWRKLQTYQSGEELFGLPTTDYPELAQIRKELNLLQKLYKLYNDVIDRVSSYYDIPWNDVNIEEINNELMEFQNRCRKLPKGLKVKFLAKRDDELLPMSNYNLFSLSGMAGLSCVEKNNR